MEALKENFKKAKSLILEKNKIVLYTHKDPDGDAIGGISALDMALKKIKKDVKSVLSGSVPSNFHFLPFPSFEESPPRETELIIILDCARLDRTGFSDKVLKKENVPIINIDHHPQEESFGHLDIVETSFTSTSELIYYLLKYLEVEIDKDIANSLLTGIFSDTGSFMHSNTTKTSLEIAAELVSRGANIRQIAENTFRKKNISTLKLWGRVLLRIKNDREKGIISSIITKKDLEECDATREDLEGVVNLINTVPKAKAALLLTEDQDQIKGSLRSENGGLDVSKVARLFGGGGHMRASGFQIKGKIHETEDGWEIVEE